MHLVTFELRKNGDLLSHADHNQVVKPNRVLRLLNEPITLEEGVTLRSFFRMMEHYPLLAEIEDWTDRYVEQVRTMPDMWCRKNMDWLEVGRRIETKVSSKTPKMVFGERDEGGFTPVSFEYLDKPYSYFSEYITLSGKRNEDHESYSLTMTPLVEILDVELRLGQCHVFSIREGELGHDVFEDTFTLNDIIHAVMTDIAFLGPDEDKEVEEKRIKEQLTEMDRRRQKASLKVIDGGRDGTTKEDDDETQA